MSEICPLVFEPIFRRKVWGGRRLARLFNKPLPEGESIGESWECADLENAQSVVARGPATGRTLHELVQDWGTQLLGGAPLVDGRFPLLIKFLDATENLSIQVHPDESEAARLGGTVRVKHEAWHILEAAPGACIYRDLLPGASVDDLRSAVQSNAASILEFLQRIPVKNGQTYFIPSGTPHAIGAGIVAAEIQTPCDVTYRLFDWNRSRPGEDAGLHVEQGLRCIQLGQDLSAFEKRSHVTSLFSTVTRLVRCPSFQVEKVRFIAELEQEIPYAEMVVWIVLAGQGEILYGRAATLEFSAGDVVVLPARMENPRVRTLTDCTWLEVAVPVESDLRAFPRPAQADLQQPEPPGLKPVPLNISIKRPADS